MKAILFLTTLVTLYAVPAFSQDITISDLRWNSTESFDIASGTTREESNAVISKGTTQLVWEKPGGTVETFTVVEVIGQWPDVAQTGEIVYEVTSEETRGTVTFIRASGAITVRLMLNRSGIPVYYDLKVSGYQIQ